MFNKRVVTFVCPFLLAAAALFIPFFSGVAAVDSAGGKPVYWFYLLRGQRFSISYTHSVNKGRVHDTYALEPSALVLQSTRFSSYGAGIPEPLPGQTFREEGGEYEIGGIDRRMDAILLFTGVLADHAIEHGGVTVYLNGLVPPQTSLIILPKRISIFTFITLKGTG